MNATLPEKVRVFIREHIETYEQLEILLFILRQRPQKWKADEMLLQLGIEVEAATPALEHLHAHGLLGCDDDAYYFNPTSPQLSKHTEELARTYSQLRFAVVAAMSTNAIDRLRSAAVRTFAEAFRLKGPKRDG